MASLSRNALGNAVRTDSVPAYDEVRTYHLATLEYYRGYAAGTGGWHYGVWDPGVRTHAEALIRANQRLLEGLSVSASSRILDVGCGTGGFAVWAASTHGCQVTGINICATQIRMADELAESRGVAHLCRFVPMDMNAFAFGPASFDIVVNQETLCYAIDKASYLNAVYRLLRPGGHWRAIAFSLREAPLSRLQGAWYRKVQAGFCIPSFWSARPIVDALERAGFVHCVAEDLTHRVAKTARLIIRTSLWKNIEIAAGVDWRRFGTEPVARSKRQGHFRAGLFYSLGLLRGCFRHNQYSATKPNA
jgi:cyclopropane fatty-acyl-phospholipid synthase-like methyltransferase